MNKYNLYQEYLDHLNTAHIEAQKAYNLLYDEDGPKRRLFYRMMLGRAQSILISLYTKEINNHTPAPKTTSKRSTDVFDDARREARNNGHQWWPASKRGLFDIPTAKDLVESRKKKGTQ